MLHIISFDVPYPPNYGGVAEVYYKLLAIKQKGIPFTLHIFTYGRKVAPELTNLAEKVFVYKRKTGWKSMFSYLPYIVKSRITNELINNLQKDSLPIFCEGLHTAGIINANLGKRKILLRMHNNEPKYYLALANTDTNFFRKAYFLIESFKLKFFERNLPKFDKIFTISDLETKCYQVKPELKNKVIKLPVFHSNMQVSSKFGKGNYILFHGNLAVSENYTAAIFLIQTVFSKVKHKIIIAGNTPNKNLIRLIEKYEHISLISSPEASEMQELIQNAQGIVLYTEQNTGTKLKLLNSVFAGRFCIANSKMNTEPALSSQLIIANSPEEIQNAIDQCFTQHFTTNQLEKRKGIFEKYYNNLQSIDILLKYI